MKTAVTHVPSAFNSQSSRTVVLFDEQSGDFWSIVKDSLKKIVPAADFGKTAEKIDSFNAGWGTVLFFEDQTTVQTLASQFPLYKENFPVWSLQSNGMLEFAIWTALENEGLGASLQHYNPLIDDAVKKRWNLDDNWKLLAQMPFGSVTSPPGIRIFFQLSSVL